MKGRGEGGLRCGAGYVYERRAVMLSEQTGLVGGVGRLDVGEAKALRARRSRTLVILEHGEDEGEGTGEFSLLLSES